MAVAAEVARFDDPATLEFALEVCIPLLNHRVLIVDEDAAANAQAKAGARAACCAQRKVVTCRVWVAPGGENCSVVVQAEVEGRVVFKTNYA